ncbi:MAG: 16S rRNA (cytosine(1402)-N(4))-methyltransferase RsmH [Muribaculaceae bacterium]|nr:16S rRNA (cytosine(1402)-N(4))-methyltransferase RsmH [Muribaculaceae bacterium]MDE6523903.1 16S rRNA (cytosine(1402)-N(4))-methyltransferase RsmH [Muribaculaceae bacterium]
MSEPTYHIPALLPQTIECLDIKPDGIYVDATFGGGGHSRAILERLGPNGRLLGFDQDEDAIANAPADPRFTFVRSNFRFMRNFLRYYGIDRVDGILADLGVSFHHFDEAQRGFSFRADAPLDMRMNQKASKTAAQLLEDFDVQDIISLFRTYADLKDPAKAAKAIIAARDKAPIQTTFELAEAVRPGLNPKGEKKEMAQVFQALRIAVNSEMDALTTLLSTAPYLLHEGGRAVILTYHSVEDRLVKNFFRSGNAEGKIEKDFFGKVICEWKPITRSPITADAEEIERNPRSRSAKLRAAELLNDR